MNLHNTVERIGRINDLDQVTEPPAKLVKRVAPPKSRVKDMLSGTWLGHALHPMSTDIPIGSFTSATLLDLIGGTSVERAADRLVDLGLLAALRTAAAGAADWSDTYGEEKRTGVVHAPANVAGVCRYAASAVAEDGTIDAAACTVTCPWHQSEFRLDTGEMVHGPASVPQTIDDTRIVKGRSEVRARVPA